MFTVLHFSARPANHIFVLAICICILFVPNLLTLTTQDVKPPSTTNKKSKTFATRRSKNLSFSDVFCDAGLHIRVLIVAPKARSHFCLNIL